MLQAANDNTRSDAELGGKALNGLGGEEPFLAQCLKCRFRDQEIGCECVSFFLLPKGVRIVCAIFGLNKHIALPVLQYMSGLVKEGEPEEVVGFTSQTELKDGFGGSKP